MKYYLPPKIPDPKRDAERRARIISALIWLAAVPPLLFMLMAFGYSDQAPAFLRELVIAFDGLFGSPVWALLNPAGAK
jgi:hypothetical protein